MRASVRALAACIAVASACSVDSIIFTPLGEPAELCDQPGDEDGNGAADCADATCAASAPCQAPPIVCTDGRVDSGEECDDGNDVNGDACDSNCTFPRCRNGATAPGEECDDGNDVNGDACDSNCTTPRCGNRAVAPGEDCDEGGVDAPTCDADCSAALCDDGHLNLLAREELEPPVSPSQVVPVDSRTCRYDFSTINQLFCAGTCGAWGGGNGCQQADADAFCKLRAGNPNSTASAFTISTATAAPGICCPTEDPVEIGCVEIGVLTARGVPQRVSVHEVNMASTHGAGQVIANVVCTDP